LGLVMHENCTCTQHGELISCIYSCPLNQRESAHEWSELGTCTRCVGVRGADGEKYGNLHKENSTCAHTTTSRQRVTYGQQCGGQNGRAGIMSTTQRRQDKTITTGKKCFRACLQDQLVLLRVSFHRSVCMGSVDMIAGVIALGRDSKSRAQGRVCGVWSSTTPTGSETTEPACFHRVLAASE